MRDSKPIAEPVYVTKWGLTQGIMKFETGELWCSEPSDEVYFSGKFGRYGTHVFVGRKDWTHSLDEARARVNTLVQRKLKSIAKQMEKLKKYTPEVIEPAKGDA